MIEVTRRSYLPLALGEGRGEGLSQYDLLGFVGGVNAVLMFQV